jgi:hypothetical protein
MRENQLEFSFSDNRPESLMLSIGNIKLEFSSSAQERLFLPVEHAKG